MATRRIFKVGDVVEVKPDVFDPDFKIPLGGWCGRITVINPSNAVLRISWDSITLQQMPVDIIERCKTEGLYWQFMSLYVEEVELATPRDTEADVAATIKAIEQGSLPASSAAPSRMFGATAIATDSSKPKRFWSFPRPAYTDHLW